MKIIDKILHFVPAAGIALFIIFLPAGFIFGELRRPFPYFLMAICFFYFIAVGVVVAAKVAFSLIKPVKAARRKIKKYQRLLKHWFRAIFSEEEDSF